MLKSCPKVRERVPFFLMVCERGGTSSSETARSNSCLFSRIKAIDFRVSKNTYSGMTLEYNTAWTCMSN